MEIRLIAVIIRGHQLIMLDIVRKFLSRSSGVAPRLHLHLLSNLL